MTRNTKGASLRLGITGLDAMGLFDFLKVKKETKGPAKGGKQTPSKGTATFNGRSFPVIEWSAKGFIIANYDADLVVEGQRFKLEFQAWDEKKAVKGKADAIVTKITD
ncbi:MAG: hypothetical protein FJX54_18630 [Alphaproteobacteria bacterium]|nr:hypothetical protein [Alphaproteobacteria bacterium]